MQKSAQTSLLDLLVRLMPEWKDEITVIRTRRRPVDHKAAKALYSIWLNAKNKLSEREFKASDCSDDEVKVMESEGLVKQKGDKIEVTAKGVEVIKTMLLGDERSVYEDDGKILDFRTAEVNTKPRVKTGRKVGGKIENKGSNWYKRLQD